MIAGVVVAILKAQLGASAATTRGRAAYLARRAGEKLGLRRREDLDNDWFHAHLVRAMRSYRAEPYGGNVLVLHRADQPSGRFLNGKLGWGDLLYGSWQIERIPDDHPADYTADGTMLHLQVFREPSVSIVAEHISRALEGCDVA